MWLFVGILFLALLRGGMYASFLPPWGLIDEEQHLDYVEHLVQSGLVPTVGETYLSTEIVQSLFDTGRWSKFHWQTPSSRDPASMGLEGFSYEGYQPPLFYLIGVPVYLFLPDSILAKLYGLRWLTVLISLITVAIAIRLTAELFPQEKLLPYAVGLTLVVIPERTAATSRVNNDGFLELVAIVFLWVGTLSILQKLTWDRALQLGLFWGLGILTKVSMVGLFPVFLFVFWFNRHSQNRMSNFLLAIVAAAVVTFPLVTRNLILYGDWTGYARFEKLMDSVGGFPKPSLTMPNLVVATWDLFRHFWVIWWNGSESGYNPVLFFFYGIFVFWGSASLVGLIRYIRPQISNKCISRETRVLVMYLALIGLYAVLVIGGYFNGQFPVIQGRFLLPVVTPMILLLVWGIWQLTRRAAILTILIGALVSLDGLVLFGKLLPYYYFWSTFFSNGQPLPYAWPGWQEAWNIFFRQFLSDKPVGMQPLIWLLLPSYLLTLVVVASKFLAFRMARPT